VYGTTTGNHANGRSDEILDRARQATQKAVAAFSDYPVYYSDDVASWIESTDQEPADISHLTPVGNQHVAASFQSAKKTSPGSSPNFIRLNP
jgi:hypothetical protein